MTKTPQPTSRVASRSGSLHFVKRDHFISEEGALHASLVMYFTMLLDLGESVSKRVMCGYSGAHTHENSSFELGLLFA